MTTSRGPLVSFEPLRMLMFKNLQECGVAPEKVKHYAYIIEESDEKTLTSIFIEIHKEVTQIFYVEELDACLREAGYDTEGEKVMRCYVNSL